MPSMCSVTLMLPGTPYFQLAAFCRNQFLSFPMWYWLGDSVIAAFFCNAIACGATIAYVYSTFYGYYSHELKSVTFREQNN